VVGESKKGEPEFKPLFQAWLEAKNRRSFREVIFAPPPLIADPQDYNLWRGYAIQPVKGDCPLFLEHLHAIICSGIDEHFQYLINLLALTMQEPGRPSEVATVLRGKPGTGKGIFVRALGDIFGRHFAHLDKVSHLVGGFNAALSGKVIVFADEAFWAGDKREVGSLKRLITEPTLRIERKGIDSVQEANCIHLFMATNEERSFPAMFHERRAFMPTVSDARMQDVKYFEALTEELRAGGLAAFLALMLEQPIDRQKIRNVPRTRELTIQQTQSLDPLREWWKDCLYEGLIGVLGWPGKTWLPARSFYEAYLAWAGQRKIRLVSRETFGQRMGDYLSDQGSKVRRIGGDPVRCLFLRALLDARMFYDVQAGSTTDWPNDQDDPPGATIPF
jgi:phage/plasmid-associated DNA primase